jgi:hypothetical protein
MRGKNQENADFSHFLFGTNSKWVYTSLEKGHFLSRPRGAFLGSEDGEE